jgi:hypothetical protein
MLLFSCSNNSGQAKTYKDSVDYYSQKLSALTDSGFSQNDSMKTMQKTRIFIYQTMRQHYIDKLKEFK